MKHDEQRSGVLSADALRRYVRGFNEDDFAWGGQTIGNEGAAAWMAANVPRFECPDKEIEEVYYFRWWTYRKHIKSTPEGYVITEFLPDVPWAGKHNTISCAAGHHHYEGRWIHDPVYLDDYSRFWLGGVGEPRRYSFWIADAFHARACATGDFRLPIELLGTLVANYEAWEQGFDWGRFRIGGRNNGLFYTIDDRDGGEDSIGGHGFRPTLNSYMYGDARAIAATARMAGDDKQAALFDEKADTIKRLVQERLWDASANFFRILPEEGMPLKDVRELYGYTPWYFNLPDPGFEAGWRELMNPEGFHAPYGPTFAEQRHPEFKISYEGHECQWNGPSWPMATSVVLTALANLLNNYKQDVIGRDDYFEALKIYTKCHRLKRDDGKVVRWIDENINPYTGEWIARTRLKTWSNGTWSEAKGGEERGKDYNHSSYCDLIISGLVGLRPRADNLLEVNPLLPDHGWESFCLDRVRYHGHLVTILWDRNGQKYGRGRGLTLLVDGKPVANATNLTRLVAPLDAPPGQAAVS